MMWRPPPPRYWRWAPAAPPRKTSKNGYLTAPSFSSTGRRTATAIPTNSRIAGKPSTHILVSQEFHPASRHAIGEVVEVEYVNEHLALRLPQASDHGIVLERIMLHGMDANAAGQQDKPTAALAPISLY